MTVIKAIRTQADGRQEEFSDAARLDCSIEGNTDMARQEFKDDADINKLLARFGINTPTRTNPQFGEVDFTADLQGALSAIADARTAHANLPPEVKKDFPTWQRLLNALERGEIRLVSDKEKPVAPALEAQKA